MRVLRLPERHVPVPRAFARVAQRGRDLQDARRMGGVALKATDISDPNYFHKVVDCQWACPAHTPVPEYIRRIAAGDYTGAYLINWKSNVFPGILGRTCDRPCGRRRPYAQGAEREERQA